MLVDHHGYAMLTTDAVPARDAFAYWREMICATFVRLAAEPLSADPRAAASRGAGPRAARRFAGRIEHRAVGDLELSTVAADAQHVRRTSRLAASDHDEYILASIQLVGQGHVEQDGRVAVLKPGDMALYDSTRPYDLHFDAPFQQLVVQVARRELAVGDTRGLTARSLGPGTPGAAISAFFRALSETTAAAPDSGTVLSPHAVSLISAAAAYAGRREADGRAASALARERVLDFLRANLADSFLDADTVAHACHMSRRTLYRIVGAEGVACQLRRLRLERARYLLLLHPDRPVSAIAVACGFASESGFHRAFRSATGRTPAAYRAERGTPGHGTPGQ